jgi:hypothetical protein
VCSSDLDGTTSAEELGTTMEVHDWIPSHTDGEGGSQEIRCVRTDLYMGGRRTPMHPRDVSVGPSFGGRDEWFTFSLDIAGGTNWSTEELIGFRRGSGASTEYRFLLHEETWNPQR